MDRVYTMEHAEKELGYGKHANYSIIELVLYEPDYIEWMEKQDNIFFSDTLKDFMDEIKNSFFTPDDEEMWGLIDEYSKMEDGFSSDYEEAKRNRAAERARNKEAHRKSLENISLMTDEDIHNYVWKYYSSGLMEEDTAEGKIIWKLVMNDKQGNMKRTIYKTKLGFGLLMFVKESTYKEEDSKWHSKFKFIADESIIVDIIKAENANPINLTKLIDSNLR